MQAHHYHIGDSDDDCSSDSSGWEPVTVLAGSASSACLGSELAEFAATPSSVWAARWPSRRRRVAPCLAVGRVVEVREINEFKEEAITTSSYEEGRSKLVYDVAWRFWSGPKGATTASSLQWFWRAYGDESIIKGTRLISGSAATRLRKRFIAASESSMPSSMLTSIIWAPASTWPRATSRASA